MNLRKIFALAVLALLFALPAHAQLASGPSDPCAIYPHQFVNIPQGTPTQTLVTGIAGQRIYLCGLIVPQAAVASQVITLSYGSILAGTPCATGTPFTGNIGIYGANGTNQTAQIGTFNTTFAVVPASQTSPVTSLCGLVGGAAVGVAVGGATLTYVQGP